MSELWDYYAVRGDVDDVIARAKKAKLRAVVGTAGDLGGADDGWVYVYAEGKNVPAAGEVVLYFFDHESAAWSFEVWHRGKSVGKATFGENLETGAEDEGFEGDLAGTAAALGVTVKKLEQTFGTPSAKRFLKLLGLGLPPFSISDVMGDAPKGVSRLRELGELDGGDGPPTRC